MDEVIDGNRFDSPDEPSFKIDSSWNSPFRELAKKDPVYQTAEAIWAVHYAAEQESELNQGLQGERAPMMEEELQRLIEYKDSLLEKLAEKEREMAIMHAQLAIGHIEDPDLSEQIKTLEDDSNKKSP